MSVAQSNPQALKILTLKILALKILTEINFGGEPDLAAKVGLNLAIQASISKLPNLIHRKYGTLKLSRYCNIANLLLIFMHDR